MIIYIDNNGNIIKNFNLDISNINSTNFELNKKYKKINPALEINFSNNLKYNIKYVKKLIYFQKSNINFLTEYNNYKIKYILSNYNDDILTAIKAIFIPDIKDKILFLYDNIFKSLDELWNKSNPCKFCNNICIASINHKTSHKEDGCCYSFEYSKNPLVFIENIQPCKYLSKDKKCLAENISCKFFVCNYLRKNKLFNIDIKDYLLVQAFFTNRQKLILKYNFFKSKKEIIEKLLEKDNKSFLSYYIHGNYRITKNK